MLLNSGYSGSCLLIVLISFSLSMGARPFASDDAGTVSKGTFELETGCDFWKNTFSTGFCLKHGLTNRMDIGLGSSYTLYPQADRKFEGALISLKFSLIPDIISLSAGGCFGNKTYNINAICSKCFKSVSFDINAGLSAIADTNRADFCYGVCCHYDGKALCCGIEINGTQEGLVFWQIGLNIPVANWLSIDAGLNGNFENEITLAATAGLTFVFPIENELMGE